MAALRPVLSWKASIARSWSTYGQTSTQNVGTIFSQQVFSISKSATDTASLQLLADQVIYAGGRSRMAVDVAKEVVLATRANLVAIEQEVLYRAVTAFMEIRRTSEALALRENNVKVITQELRAARDRFDVGEVTRTDVALAEARLASAKSALAAAQGNLVSAREEYIAAVGHAPRGLVAPAGLPNLPENVDDARAHALREHPQMVAMRHQVSAAELGVAIAEGAKMPTVSVGTALTYSGDVGKRDFTRSGSLTIGAQGPIYSGGALEAAVRKARASRDAQRGSQHVVQSDIIRNVGNAYVQLNVARANRSSFESQVRAATVAFRGVREEAKLGARTTLDVLDAEQELLLARTNLSSAQVDEAIASYAVLGTMGLLTADALHLDVPRFDPEAYYNQVRRAPATYSRQGRDLDRVLRALGEK